MDGSSNIQPHETLDGRHLAAIEAARRQFERVSARVRPSSSSGFMSGVGPHPLEWLAAALPGYELGDEIHRGGQGVVYHAVQRGTHRPVAIKVMRGGHLGEARTAARFEREIQILGQFRHPHIVTIHDSGSGSGGFYFVMDYIEGLTLDAYVAHAQPDVEQTLQLFVKICDAVHAAHLHGVIHRDLKPANIRVDKAGEPHLLDFGLAKLAADAEGSALSSEAISTTGQFVGSLPWASPEQLEGRPGDIDIRTDVYALGVILYQLLAGRLPHEVTGNMRQVLENICRNEPVAPSARRAGIARDLDAIVLKSLSKERADRYQSAGQLGEELKRYLRGEAVEARRGNAWYVLRKQLRRHRGAAILGSVMATIVAAAFFSSLAFWRQAVRDRDTAQRASLGAMAALTEAESQGETAKAVTRFLTHDVLLKLDPYNTQGEAVTAKALFEQATRDVDAGAFAQQPRVEVEVRTVLGMVSLWMTSYSDAEAQFRAALSILEGAADPKNAEAIALTMGRLGTALSNQGKLDEAEPLLRRALDMQMQVSGPDHRSTLMARSALAGWCIDASRGEEAEQLYRDLLAARTRLQGPDHSDTLAVMSKLAESIMIQDRYAEAEALFHESLRRKVAVHGERHPEVLLDRMHLAGLLHADGRIDEAKPQAEAAYAGLRERLGPSHGSTQAAMLTLARIHRVRGERAAAEKLLRCAVEEYRAMRGGGYQVVELLLELATVLTQQGKPAEAEGYLREALQVHDRVGGRPGNKLRILAYLVGIMGEQGNAAGALAPAEECLRIGREIYGDDHESTVIFINNYAFALGGAGKWKEAEAQYRSALETQRRMGRENTSLSFNMMHNLALSLKGDASREERVALLREALAGRRRLLGDADPMTLKTIHALASHLRDDGELAEAETLFREALTRSEAVWPEGHFMVEHYRRGLGVCLKEAGRFEDAEPLLQLSRDRDVTLLPPGHPNHEEGLEKLIELYEAWGKPESAEPWREQLRALRGEDADARSANRPDR